MMPLYPPGSQTLAELAEPYDEATTVIGWAKRLRCSQCAAREADFFLSDRRG